MKKLFKYMGIAVVAVVILSIIFSGGREEESLVERKDAEFAQVVEDKEVEVAEDKPEAEAEDKEVVAPAPESKEEVAKEEVKPEPKEEVAKETVSQKNAVKQAEQYIKLMPFSKTGLINQLEFEGYSNADAVYAVDKIKVDWREQAVRHAKQYVDLMPFSRSGLIDQLVFEGHSRADSEYAATQVGL